MPRRGPPSRSYASSTFIAENDWRYEENQRESCIVESSQGRINKLRSGLCCRKVLLRDETGANSKWKADGLEGIKLF